VANRPVFGRRLLHRQAVGGVGAAYWFSVVGSSSLSNWLVTIFSSVLPLVSVYAMLLACWRYDADASTTGAGTNACAAGAAAAEKSAWHAGFFFHLTVVLSFLTKAPVWFNHNIYALYSPRTQV
jgi:hypothetical protein